MVLTIQPCENALALRPADWVLHQKLAQTCWHNPRTKLCKPGRSRNGGKSSPWYPALTRKPISSWVFCWTRLDKLPEAEAQLRLAVSLKGNITRVRSMLWAGFWLAKTGLAEALENYQKRHPAEAQFSRGTG